jgi:hypothetical protein
MDPYPLQGWRWIDIDGLRLLESPLGQKCATTAEAFDYELANQGGDAGDKDLRCQLTMIQKFLNQCCSESLIVSDAKASAADGSDNLEEAPVRQVVTTSPLEDWLWRGDHPILRDMHWYAYSMWVFRVEKLPLKLKEDGETVVPGPRFIDIEFSSDYKLHKTHKQRIASEFRVPLFEGFTMLPSSFDSETAAMYKSLLLRALVVKVDDQPEDVRFANAFTPLCEVAGQVLEPNEAFTRSWLAHVTDQKMLATEAARRFLDRYEYMSLWETKEVQDELAGMWDAAQDARTDMEVDAEGGALIETDVDSPNNKSRGVSGEGSIDPDEGKPRVTVRQYAALIGQKVMSNLEGLARARREKHPRAYQTDAEVHQAYISATSGGAGAQEDGPEDGPKANEAPRQSDEVFPLLPWSF